MGESTQIIRVPRAALFICLVFCMVMITMIALVSGPAKTASAQQSYSHRQNEVSSLVKQLKNKGDNTAFKAGLALIEMGPEIIPQLLGVLETETGCEMRFIVSGVIYQIDKSHPIVNATLVDIIRGKCSGFLIKDRIARREAAFALVVKEEGIPVMARMLSENDTFIRRSAAFAFDELTERIDGRPPEVEITPGKIAAIRAAMPLLIQALYDKDEIVRCMSLESMKQLEASKHAELRTTANILMPLGMCSCLREKWPRP
jgi:HEAT repeat protein